MFKKFHCIGCIFLVVMLGPRSADAQLNTVPIGELTDSMRRYPKPALILISTDWCAYCRIQRAQLNKSQGLRGSISAMYFSELDAETKQELVFKGRTYRFVPNGVATGSHELAFALGNIDNRLSFPTWVLINENFETIFKFPGVIKASELSKLLETVLQGSPPPGEP